MLVRRRDAAPHWTTHSQNIPRTQRTIRYDASCLCTVAEILKKRGGGSQCIYGLPRRTLSQMHIVNLFAREKGPCSKNSAASEGRSPPPLNPPPTLLPGNFQL